MSVLLIFVDGVGIGTRGAHNPLDGLDAEFFAHFKDESPRLPFDAKLAVTDARLGVDGLPQSATGQTAILTGVNAASLIGRHLNGYPSPRLKQALSDGSIYKRLLDRGRSVTFANAYTPRYFDARPRFVSATTVAAESAGVRLRTLEDLDRGEAIFHDFTNYSLIGMGHTVKSRKPEEAGRLLARLAAAHDFTLYEHFITDRLGHLQNREWSRAHVALLNRFVKAAVKSSDLKRQTIVVTSDHGNIEDLSSRSHTFNAVATITVGAGADFIRPRIASLTDITPAIVDYLTAE